MAHRAWIIGVGSALVAIATTFAIYWPGLSGGFIFDDFPNLVLSDGWKATSTDPLEWRRVAFSDTSGPVGRPLALLSFGINYYFTGMDPFWLKLTSLGLHLLNGALVWLLCRKIFAIVGSGPRPGELAAALVACAWMLHPLQVSSVLYIVQRMEIGAQTGVLLALIAYLHGRTRQTSGQRAWPWFVLSLTATLFGIGFKESAALAPGFALLLEALILRFVGRDGRISRPWIICYAIGALFALIAYTQIALVFTSPASGYAVRDFGPIERLLTQLSVLTMYLKQVMLPWPDSMWFYYDNFPVSKGLISPPGTALAAALLLGLATIAVLAWRNWPLATLGIGWFFLAHALTSNVIPLELAFEHRNYLALLGILLALVQPLMVAGRRLTKEAQVVVAALPVLGLAALCTIQAATWGDPMRLALALENRNPTSPRATYDLGMRFLLMSAHDSSSPAWSMAKSQFERSLSLAGASALPSQALLVMHGRAELDIPDEMWEVFRRSLIQNPLGSDSLSALHAVSHCRIIRQCRLDEQQLLDTFLAVIAQNPKNGTAHALYANFAWNAMNDPKLAVTMQREAVALAPSHLGLRISLAKFLLATGEKSDRRESLAAIETLRRDDKYGLHAAEIEELEVESMTKSEAADLHWKCTGIDSEYPPSICR